MVTETLALVERVFREDSGQAVATLIRVLGDFDLAEEAADAYRRALDQTANPVERAFPGGRLAEVDRHA